METAGAFQLTLGEADYLALPEGALFRPSDHTLFLADAHLGKADIFQSAGLNIPAGHVEHDLERLHALIRRLGVRRLVILGDWIHGRLDADGQTIAAVTRFREATTSVECHLLQGNHDRGIRPHLDAWQMQPLAEGRLAFGILPFHVPPPGGTLADSTPVLAGHLHPAVRLRAPGGDRLRVPCFLRQKGNRLILPAFGSFTGGALVKPAPDDTVLALLNDRVLPVPPTWLEDVGR